MAGWEVDDEVDDLRDRGKQPTRKTPSSGRVPNVRFSH
jgi:hypothetical protein